MRDFLFLFEIVEGLCYDGASCLSQNTTVALDMRLHVGPTLVHGGCTHVMWNTLVYCGEADRVSSLRWKLDLGRAANYPLKWYQLTYQD